MTRKCGFVAVVGTPNAGKSTLVNALVGTKVSIVSPKVQTTRSRVTGIVIHNGAQIILVDTPGVFTPSRRLERAMVSRAADSLREADSAILVVDAARARRDPDLPALLDRLENAGTNAALVLNKVDLVKKPDLLGLAEELNQRFDFRATFMVSALKEQGLAALSDCLAAQMDEGPWLFDEETASDMPVRLLAAEITREHAFRRLHQEIPYGLTVETEHWEAFDNGNLKIGQVIYVTRANHKGIVLGKGGQKIKAIGTAARHELAEILETSIHLNLHVKVRENWPDEPERYAAMGLDFNV